MTEVWVKHCERLVAIERKQRVFQNFLSQFWIWRPYSKHSLSKCELFERGFENLGYNYQQQKGNQNEQ